MAVAIIATIFAIVATITTSSCSPFDGTDDPPPATPGDGGDGPAPVTGNGQGDLKIAFEKVTLVHGATARLAIAITRIDGYMGPVVVTAKGLPQGITAQPIMVAPDATSGTLELVVDGTAKPGPLAGSSIEARSPDGRQNTSAPLDGIVRGAPGELDTSFGTGGAITLPPGDYESYDTTMDTEGRIYVSDSTSVRRYGVDGALDTTFGSGGTAVRKQAGIPVGLVLRGGALYIGSVVSGPAYGNVEKMQAATGAPDLGYGADSVSGALSPLGLAVGDNGGVVTFTSNNGAGFVVWWLKPAGNPDNLGYPNATTTLDPPYDFRSGIVLGDGVVGVGHGSGGTGFIAKVRRDGGGFDTAFAGTGYKAVSGGLYLNDILRDSEGRFVVGGVSTSDKSLVVARVTAGGAIDSSFPGGAIAGNFKTYGVTRTHGGTRTYLGFGTSLALQSDGKVLLGSQVAAPSSTKCQLHRTTASGHIDTSFGSGGEAVLPTLGCIARRLHVQPSGRIVVGGPVIVRVWD